jgi:esterase/lipase superfamily enzyme
MWSSEIGRGYERSSKEAPAYSFWEVIVHFSEVVLALRTIYEVIRYFGEQLEVDEIYAHVVERLKGQVDNRLLVGVRHLIQVVLERTQSSRES